MSIFSAPFFPIHITILVRFGIQKRLFLFAAAAGSAVSVKPASDSVTPASVSGMGTLTDSGSGPASLLNASNQTLGALGQSEDLPPSTIPPPQHNKYVASDS